MYAALGTVEFDLVSYWSDFSHQQGVDFAEHALIGKKPRLQFVGDKLDTLNIGMKFHFAHVDPEAELAKLRTAMSAKRPLRLVLGNGRYEGRFVIESIGHDQWRCLRDGTKLHISVQVGLKEFVPADPVAERKADAKQQATARQAAAPKRTAKVRATGRSRNRSTP